MDWEKLEYAGDASDEELESANNELQSMVDELKSERSTLLQFGAGVSVGILSSGWMVLVKLLLLDNLSRGWLIVSFIVCSIILLGIFYGVWKYIRRNNKMAALLSGMKIANENKIRKK